MNKNLVIGLLAGVIVVGGIWWVASMPKTTPPPSQGETPTGYQPPASPQEGVPVVTTNATVSVSNTTALVSGRVTPNGAQTSYWYEYGKTNALGSQTAKQSVGSGFVAVTAPAFITNLTPGTVYYFRLSAENTHGQQFGLTYTFTTDQNPPPKPPVSAAPTTVTGSASSVSRTAANLSGSVNPNGSETVYWFEYGKTEELGATTAFQSLGSGTASQGVSVSISNLAPSTKYYFRLNAQNQYGTINSSIKTFTTAGPPAPGQPSASATSAANVTRTSATLRGAVNPNGDSTTYWFEYSDDSLLGNIVGRTTETQVTDSGNADISVAGSVSGLRPNTHYYYRVVARNQYGTVQSGIADFRTSN